MTLAETVSISREAWGHDKPNLLSGREATTLGRVIQGSDT